MEIVSSTVYGLGDVNKEEKSDKAVADYGKVRNGRQADEENKFKSPSPKGKDSDTEKQDEELECAKVEMGQVREENKRLKAGLAQLVKDYESLQTHFFDIMQHEEIQKPVDPTPMHEDEEHELISLSLGSRSSEGKKEDKTFSKSRVYEDVEEGLALGLDCKFERGQTEPVPEDRFCETKEGEIGEQWPPSKLLKTMRGGDGDVSEQPPMKKARVSVRARCDTPTMNDGCQWRKYGQKISKGNPCPRAYYRCTVAPACPVRKQVQRCIDDMSILITTYEGTHSHPLPASATAMASTTSAAAYMLTSGSTTSTPGFPSTASADLHGLNFNLSNQFYLPNTSISSSPSCPTITLDLTAHSLSQHPFNRLSSNFPSMSRYSPASFSFASDQSNTQSSSWGNRYLKYGAQPYNNQQHQHLNQPYHNTQQSLTDTITAATKAVTSDPTFQSALAAAITSIVNKGGGLAESLSQNLKRTDLLHSLSRSTSTYLNRSATSSNPPLDSTTFLLPFTSTNTSSASPVESRHHLN